MQPPIAGRPGGGLSRDAWSVVGIHALFIAGVGLSTTFVSVFLFRHGGGLAIVARYHVALFMAFPLGALVAGYVAAAHVPETVPSIAPSPAPSPALPLRQRLTTLVEQTSLRPSYLFRSIAALGAACVVLLGVVPMAVASVQPNASPILAEAADGSPGVTDFAAPPFRLVDQNGRPVSLAGLRGKVVALTFLDPVCTSDCPLIAQELREADAMLAPALREDVEFVAIDANPLYQAPAYLLAFDRQEGLQHVPNWRYLTGSARELARVWNAYGVQVQYEPGGAMIGHSELGFVIDARGRVRATLETAPGAGTAASRSSFAVTLDDQIRRVERSS